MKNFKLTIEYDGSRYSGWQRLGKGESTNTIENKIKEVLKKMSGQDVELFCGSRTEAGIHAYGQVISCKLDTDLSAAKVRQYLNRYLPMDIAVLEAEEMPERFHAALNARSRTYVYRVAIGDVPSVFERKYTYYCFGRPDVSTMKEAAALLKGTHDFAAFSTAKKSKSTVRTITDLEVYADDKELQITITANDFLHNMARIIASTLLDIGLGKRPVSDIPAIFDPKAPAEASVPADPQGLFLERVDY